MSILLHFLHRSFLSWILSPQKLLYKFILFYYNFHSVFYFQIPAHFPCVHGLKKMDIVKKKKRNIQQYTTKKKTEHKMWRSEVCRRQEEKEEEKEVSDWRSNSKNGYNWTLKSRGLPHTHPFSTVPFSVFRQNQPTNPTYCSLE